MLLRLLNDAEDDRVFLAMPTSAIAGAETVLRAGDRLWTPFLLFHGVSPMDLTVHVALAAARLAPPLNGETEADPLLAPLMIGHVVYEAQAMTGVVVTLAPQVYTGFDVAVMAVDH